MDYKHVEEVFLYAGAVYPLFALFPPLFLPKKIRFGGWVWGGWG